MLWTAGILEAALATLGLLILRYLTKLWALTWSTHSHLHVLLSLAVFSPLLLIWWMVTKRLTAQQPQSHPLPSEASEIDEEEESDYEDEDDEEEEDDDSTGESGESSEGHRRDKGNYSPFLDSHDRRLLADVATADGSNGDSSFNYTYRELSRSEIELDEKEPLSYGAFSVVYRGRWRGVECAVKQLNAPTVDPIAKRKFRKEASLMQELGHHPNIVTFFGAVTTGHCMWLVTEYHKMGSVHDFYKRYRRKTASPGTAPPSDDERGPTIPLELLVKLAADAALGILHLHRENVIHRDIAARNVLVGGSFKSGFRAVITDFGLSRVKTTAGTTMSNIGPVKWMAPEAIVDKAYSEASDAFSFGVLLWEMVTGRVPWEDEDALQVAMKVGKDSMTLSVPLGCDQVLAELMTRCWDQCPTRRPTFVEMHTRLQNHYEELKDEAADRKAKRNRRRRRSKVEQTAAADRGHSQRESESESEADKEEASDRESSEDYDNDDDGNNEEWEGLAIAKAAEDYRMQDLSSSTTSTAASLTSRPRHHQPTTHSN